jgi:hypothetical protein
MSTLRSIRLAVKPTPVETSPSPLHSAADTEPLYLACRGLELIDTDRRLYALVDSLMTGPPLGNSHVVVWLVGPQGDGPRAVALLRPTVDGAPFVTWM